MQRSYEHGRFEEKHGSKLQCSIKMLGKAGCWNFNIVKKALIFVSVFRNPSSFANWDVRKSEFSWIIVDKTTNVSIKFYMLCAACWKRIHSADTPNLLERLLVNGPWSSQSAFKVSNPTLVRKSVLRISSPTISISISWVYLDRSVVGQIKSYFLPLF